MRNPPALFSQNGYLSVRFSYRTTTDDEGRTLFSFMTPDGLENPTLHVHPGDHLIVTITNNTPVTPIEMPAPPPTCRGSVMTHSPVNIHFHGTNTSPICGQDEVVHTDVLLPTAGRAEFIVEAPQASVKVAELLTRKVNTGPDGDNDTRRTLASIQTTTADHTLENDALVSNQSEPNWRPRFRGLATAAVTNRRHLFFSENNPKSLFFITVEGEKRALYNPANPPAIVTTQGSVEDWTIENRTLENHEFHLHQTHFLVVSEDNFALNGTEPDRTIEGQYLDTIQVPYWDGNPDHPYPKVKVRVDFRGPDVGDFVYHCHIAEHEDGGMIAIIRVLPFPGPAASNSAASISE